MVITEPVEAISGFTDTVPVGTVNLAVFSWSFDQPPVLVKPPGPGLPLPPLLSVAVTVSDETPASHRHREAAGELAGRADGERAVRWRLPPVTVISPAR